MTEESTTFQKARLRLTVQEKLATMIYTMAELLEAFAPTTPPADVDPEVILEMFRIKHDLSPDAINMLRELMQR